VGFLAAAGWFVVPFTLGPEIFGVLLGDGEADVSRSWTHGRYRSRKSMRDTRRERK
jgi:hypothetical protein